VKRGRAADGRTLLLSAAVLCCLVSLFAYWPGELTPDSLNQLEQARTGHLTDWHPPLMAVIWELWPQPAVMLVIQIGLHWLGIGCLAGRLQSDGSKRWAWAMLALGFTPIAFKYVGVIQKDSLLASCMIAAFGVACWSRLAAFVLSVAGGLVRVNGTFAVGPLWTHLVRPRTGQFVTAAVSLVVGVFLIPIAVAANHHLFGARPSGVERSIQLYDLAGIAEFSGDKSVLPVSIDNLRRCYTPLFWDTLGQPRCGRAYNRLPDSISAKWLRGIVRHPLDYAEHRFTHFNREIFFLVPAMQQCVDAPDMHRCDMSRRGYLVDALAKNFLLWPVTWLVAGLFLLARRPEPLAQSLCLSGLLYGFAYLFVGVAADLRYFYWTELAVQAALLLHFARGRRLPAKPLAITLAIVFVTGYAARYATLI
jgi:hypothetical protein